MAQAMEEVAKGVEMYTGMKSQFVNAGWSEPNAEQMVIGIVFQGVKSR